MEVKDGKKFSGEFNFASREKSIFRGNLISRISIKQTFSGNLISQISQIVRLLIFIIKNYHGLFDRQGGKKVFFRCLLEPNQSKRRKLKFSREFNFVNYVKSDFSREFNFANSRQIREIREIFFPRKFLTLR